ncbi:MAG: PAS domain-containing protein [Pseudolabrys sp.]|nr:PAS domain-containing protein [Pseudolabrys sp.]
MKHTSTRELYAYWNARRGTRPAPERADIDPVDIRHQLGDTFMLAADYTDQLRFRLAGTRVCALFGREIKGETVAALWDEAGAQSITDLMTVVVNEQIGAVAGLIGRAADGAEVELEMLILPLAHTGHARIRALGVLVPTVPLYWLGAKPVAELSLRTIRHIGPELDSLQAPVFALAPAQAPEPEPASPPTATPTPIPMPVGGRVQHGFVVYSGGRETPSEEQTG